MKLALLASLVLTSTSAFAYNETAQNLIPASGQNEIMIGAAYQNSSITASNSAGDEKITTYETPLSYYYGITDFSAFGVRLAYTSSTLDLNANGTSSTSKTKGLGDITVSYKGHGNQDAMTGYYEVGAQVPPEKAKANFDNLETNEASGQIHPFLTLGIATPMTSWIVGFEGTYNHALDGNGDITSSGSTFSGTIKGGSYYALALYGEMPSFYHFNASLNYKHSYGSKFEADNNAGSITYIGQETLALMLQARHEFTPGFEIIPLLGYSTLLNKSALNLDKVDAFSIGLALRSTF